MLQERRPHDSRLKALRRVLRRHKVEAILATGPRNVEYLTGFTGEDSALLATADGAYFLTDSRYTEQAGQQTRGIEILERRRGLMELAGRCVRRTGVNRLGVEGNHLTVEQHLDLQRFSGKAEIVPLRSVVEELRQVKAAEEVRKIEAAVRVAEQAFLRIRPLVRPGRSERELAHALDAAMRDLGAEGPGFPTIVAAAERSSLPHAQPTARALRSGDAVLFDWGARCDSYTSDLTRVLFVDTIPQFYQRIYPLVLDAQRRALRRTRPGLRADQIDGAARDFLKSKRLHRRFGHGLGHGLGLEVHELPVINGRSRTVLRPGMVFTVEPGVYLPGRGGVRIEDDVLVTRDGSRALTSLPKSLRETVVGA